MFSLFVSPRLSLLLSFPLPLCRPLCRLFSPLHLSIPLASISALRGLCGLLWVSSACRLYGYPLRPTLAPRSPRPVALLCPLLPLCPVTSACRVVLCPAPLCLGDLPLSWPSALVVGLMGRAACDLFRSTAMRGVFSFPSALASVVLCVPLSVSECSLYGQGKKTAVRASCGLLRCFCVCEFLQNADRNCSTLTKSHFVK